MTQPVDRILIVLVMAAAVTAAVFVDMSYCAVLSKPPTLSEVTANGIVHHYIREFNQMNERGDRTSVALDDTPDQPWRVYIEEVEEDFFSLRLRNKNTRDSRLLFTFWAADIGSGTNATVRWSKDGKALQITGDTKGFSYKPIPDADPKKFESFNFIYLVYEDKMYSVQKDSA